MMTLLANCFLVGGEKIPGTHKSKERKFWLTFSEIFIPQLAGFKGKTLW